MVVLAITKRKEKGEEEREKDKENRRYKMQICIKMLKIFTVL